MTFEEFWENACYKDAFGNCEPYYGIAKYAFEVGQENGTVWHKPTEHITKWHDLRKNPDDLPSANQQVCMCYVCHVDNEKHTVVGAYIQVGYHCVWNSPYNNVFDDEVIAWCETPKFEEVKE